jgi:hypothetical protein
MSKKTKKKKTKNSLNQQALMLLIYGLLKKARKENGLNINSEYLNIKNESMVILLNVFNKLHFSKGTFATIKAQKL